MKKYNLKNLMIWLFAMFFSLSSFGQAIDYTLNNIDVPSDVCGQSFIDVTLEYTNIGVSTGDTLNFTYVEQYSLTTVNEQIIVNTAAGLTGNFTFTTPFAINPNLDSNYCFTAYLTMGANGDDDATNDSVMTPICVHNGVLLPSFTTYGATIPYATTATLVADTIGTGLGLVKWYADSNDLTEIFVGDTLITPILYSTQTYWAEGVGGFPDVKFTEVAQWGNSGSGSGSPSWLSVDDYIEFTNLGAVEADMSGWVYHRRGSTLNYTLPAGASIASGQTMILSTVGGSANITYNLYVAGNSSTSSGTATGHWLEDASGDIIDVVAISGYDVVSNSAGALTTADWSGNVASSSSNAGTTRIASDNNTASDWVISSVTALNTGTLNLALSVASGAASSCPTPRIPVTATVTNIPLVDAGIVEIINPINGFDGTIAQDIEVVVANFTSTSLLATNIVWDLNGVQTTYAYSNMSGLAQGELDTVVVSNQLIPTVVNNFVAYTSMPNGTADAINFNDTTMYSASSCFTGTITIGSTAGNDFVTISDALTTLENSEICGHTTFLLDAETFTEQVVVNPIIGSGPNAILTFKGHGDLTKITAAGNTTDRTIFSIRGAEYITLDSIFIEGTGSYAYGLHFNNRANHISVLNSHIKVALNSSSSNKIAVTTGTLNSYTSGAVHVNNLLLSNNLIEGGYRGINLYGTSSENLTDIDIINNTIKDNYYYSTYLYYCDSLDIHYNDISNTTYRFQGIYAYHCEATNVTNNYLHGYGTSSHYGLYLSYVNQASSSFRGQITNNRIIFNKPSGTYTSTTYGIYNNRSYYNDFVNNTVYISDAYTSTSSRCMHNYYSTDTRIINNLFINEGKGYTMYHGSSSNYLPIQCDNNNYYRPNTANSYFIYFGGNKTDLAAMQAASSYDDNSLSVDPNFASTMDGHIMSAVLDSAALPWTSVVNDMDMEMRDATNPDIGADEFDYRTKDLVANTIINPISPVVIGQNVYPSIKVQSMGGDTIFSYDISYQINNGAVITESNTTTLAFYNSENYTFTTAGVYAPATDFLLTAWVSNVMGDIELSNDTISTTVTVRAADEDAAIALTYAPTAIIYQVGQVVYPSIDLANYGINTIDTCDISYKFNDGYMVTETYYGSLALNQNTTFTFTTGYPVTLASTDIEIFTSLTGDIVNYNDTSKISFSTILPPHDAGVSDIINPGTSAFINGTSINPQVEITNYGTNSETSIDITYISGVNTVTETWTGSLAPGATMYYTFTQDFVYDFAYPSIKAYSTLTNDILWSNDTTNRPIFFAVIDNDVALTSIDDPIVNTYEGQYVYPTVTIANEGYVTHSAIDVTYIVNGGTPVTETWTGTVITYQASTTYTFSTPFVAPAGTYSLCVYTQLSNDADISNDTTCASITSIAPTIDVGVSAITAPAASSPMYQEVFPTVTLENFATTAQTSFDVTYVMDNNTVTETWTGNLAAGATTTYTFTQGTITPLYDFNLCVYTELTTDQIAPNDSTCILVMATAALEDVGISAIIEPTATVYIGQTIMPTVTIENFGTNTQTSLDVTYILNGVSVTETWTGSLAAGATDNYTFTQGIVIGFANLDICAHTNSMLDLIHSNDTICMATIMPTIPANDVGILSIANPTSTDVASNNNIASVWIYNYGTSAQTSIPVAYQIDALPAVQETWTGNLASGDSVIFTFTTMFESTVDYQFCAVTNLSSDQVIENDSKCLSVVIGIGENIAQDISLEQNIPNPATYNTLINFNVPNNGTAVLAIRDLQGRLIYTEQSNVLAGSNSFSINTENYASGLYLYTLNFNGVSLSKKMNIQK